MRLLRRMLRLLVVGRANGVRRRFARAVTRAPWRGPVEAPAPAPVSAPAVATPPVDPDGWTDVGAWAELEERALVEVRVAGEPVAIALIDGKAHAISGTCLHAGGPLADGALEGNSLTCPYHGWSYDVTTGRCLVDDALVLARYDVRQTEGRIRIKSADPGVAAPTASALG